MQMLRTGDPCPCCGQPIKTRDPDLLQVLTFIRDHRRFLTIEERRLIGKEGREKGGTSDG